MPSYVSAALTRTANGKDIYIPASSAGGGNVIPGNLQVVGNMSVGGTSVLTGLVSAVGALNVGGALAATGAVSGASLSVTGAVSSATLATTGAATVGTSVTAASAVLAALGGAFLNQAQGNAGATGIYQSIVLGNTKFVYGTTAATSTGGNATAALGSCAFPVGVVPLVIATPYAFGDTTGYANAKTTSTNDTIYFDATATGGGGFNDTPICFLAIGRAV